MRRFLMRTLSIAAIGCVPHDACPECDIELVPLVELGEEDGAAALSGMPYVALSPKGPSFLVTLPGATPGELPRLFDARGKFRSALGSVGEGPGEYRSARRAFASHDSMFVFDRSGNRVTVLVLPDSVVRTTAWSFIASEIVELPDGSFVVARDGDASGLPLHHVSRAGTRLESFGDPLASRLELRQERLARAPDGTFWSAPSQKRLRLQQWLGPGVRGPAVDVSTTHFSPYDEYVPADWENPPSPTLRGMWVDSASTIWLLVEVPSTEWRRGLDAPRQGEAGRTFAPVRDALQVWDSLVLQVDPLTGEVLAERRLESWFYQVVAPGVLATYIQNADGWYTARLWRVNVRRTNQ